MPRFYQALFRERFRNSGGSGSQNTATVEEFSSIKNKQRLKLPITLSPCWRDHRYMGQSVLPAVDAMDIMAGFVKSLDATLDIHCPGQVRFDQFLELPEDQNQIETFCDVTTYSDGSVGADLVTRKKPKSALMTRTFVHAGLRFWSNSDELYDLPLRLDADLKGKRFALPAKDVYEDLVPFGPCYHTLTGNLQISKNGVLAELHTPAPSQSSPFAVLGSPFALDAAFHAASVWTQRFKRVVAFPISLSQRIILEPTQPDRNYYCRILPTCIQNEIFYFDIWIFDHNSRLNEVAQGVGMGDVSQGHLTPPDWITADAVVL